MSDTTDESGDGDYESDIKRFGGEKIIRSKTGDDGIEETHITYVPMKYKSRTKPLGDKWEQIDWGK